MLPERILRLLGNPPPPCGADAWSYIRWHDARVGKRLAAELEALHYLPRESITPANDTDPDQLIETIPVRRQQVA